VESRKQRGSSFSIVAVAEGAYPAGGQPVVRLPGDSVYVPRLGGIGQVVAERIAADCQVETRVTVLGHLQRGGSPTPYDRVLATRLGAAAVRLAAAGGFGRMVALKGDCITDLPLAEALAVPRRVDLQGDAVRTARGMGICLGD
jgi:6-phosphofructokinase 1